MSYYEALKDDVLGRILNYNLGPFDGHKCWNNDPGKNPLRWYTALKDKYDSFWRTPAQLEEEASSVADAADAVVNAVPDLGW